MQQPIVSRLRWYVWLLVAFAAFTGYITYMLIATIVEAGGIVYVLLPIALFFICVILWIVRSELRKKATKFEIDEVGVKVSGFGGLGTSSTYTWRELSGYSTSRIHAQQGIYEYLYLIRNGKKVAMLSQFYHSNYEELKAIIDAKLPNPKYEKFRMKEELERIFM